MEAAFIPASFVPLLQHNETTALVAYTVSLSFVTVCALLVLQSGIQTHLGLELGRISSWPNVFFSRTALWLATILQIPMTLALLSPLECNPDNGLRLFIGKGNGELEGVLCVTVPNITLGVVGMLAAVFLTFISMLSAYM